MKILVAGIGNIFKADDAFGVEVVRRLGESQARQGVEAIDFGIRGLDFAYALLDGGYDAVIIIDAMGRGKPPGTLTVLEPTFQQGAGQPEAAEGGVLALEPHSMDPYQVLRWVQAMGGSLRQLRIVGCEPLHLPAEDEIEMGLSEPVAEAVNGAVAVVGVLLDEFFSRSRADAQEAGCTSLA